MEKTVRAIDVGYGNTKLTLGTGGKLRCSHFPSVAPAAPSDPRAGLGGRRKTAVVHLDGLFYEVGPDASLAVDVYQTRQMHDHYCETPEYLALVRGALHFMKQTQIDLLVVGLPVTTYKTRRAALERRLRGDHLLVDGKQAHIARVKVVAQPQGALMYHGLTNGTLANINGSRNLVLDAGARTFDWLVAQGTRIIEKRSGAANRGMFDVLHRLAQAISHERNTDYRDYDRLDVALRSGKQPKVFGSEFDLSPHLRGARKIAEDAVNEMLRHVGDGNDIDNIFLSGGAALFFRDAVGQAFPRHKVKLVSTPLYANVLGFQAAGEELMRAEPGYAPDALSDKV